MTDDAAQHGALRIEVDGPTLRLRGELDMEGAPALEERLRSLLSGAETALVVDLADLTFIDSTGLQCLLRVSEQAKEGGQELRFRRGSGQVEEVMQLTRVGDLLPFAD